MNCVSSPAPKGLRTRSNEARQKNNGLADVVARPSQKLKEIIVTSDDPSVLLQTRSRAKGRRNRGTDNTGRALRSSRRSKAAGAADSQVRSLIYIQGAVRAARHARCNPAARHTGMPAV